MLSYDFSEGQSLPVKEVLDVEHKLASIKNMRTASICAAIGAIAGSITAVVALLAFLRRKR